MSVAFFIVTEREIDGLDTFVNGKAIAGLSDEVLQAACTAAGVRSVYDYVSADPEELADFLDDEALDDSMELAPEEWFTAAEGLAWTMKLTAHLEAHPAAVDGSAAVLADLAEYRAVFEALQSHDVRWHFQVDF